MDIEGREEKENIVKSKKIKIPNLKKAMPVQWSKDQKRHFLCYILVKVLRAQNIERRLRPTMEKRSNHL